jgi:uncharacterized protein YpmB
MGQPVGMSMNKIQTEMKRRESIGKIDEFKLSHKCGCVRVNTNNTILHELKKFEIAFGLIKEGHKVATECVSKDGKRRYDVIDFDTGKIYEVESGKSYEKKDDVIVVRI